VDGGRERPAFDPLATLRALDAERSSYILIGALARVIHGADERTIGVDITPSMKAANVQRLTRALENLDARTTDGAPIELDTAKAVIELDTRFGRVNVVPEPAGTRGYDDLRRAASREPIGAGLRPVVASAPDLARMLAALGREQDADRLHMLRRLIELEHGRDRGLAL
jgi:hypothetical protein